MSHRTVDDLISYLPMKSGQPVEPGCHWATPRREGLQALVWRGAPEPFALFSVGNRFFSGRSTLPLIARRPRPGCGSPRRGLASLAALGREESAAAEHEEGSHAPFFIEPLAGTTLTPLQVVLAGSVLELRANASESGRALLRHIVSVMPSTPRDLIRAPPLLRRRSSRRTRVGRA